MLIWFVVGAIALSVIAFKYYGRNRESDSFKLMERLASQGDARAQINLAMMYYGGTGVRQDLPKAIQWAEKPARQGNAEALFVMGMMHTQKNDTKAFEFYLQSANQGYPSAQYELSLMYEKGKGIGVQQDYAKAFEWYTRSASQGDARAQFNLGRMYHFGKGVQQDDAKARDWLGKSCKNGFQDACTIYRLLPKR